MKPSYLVMLFASEILECNRTIEEVPAGLRAKTKAYLESVGYEFNVQ